MNMFARFDENPAMTLQVIKKTKRYGRTDTRTHARTDNVKTVYPTTNKVCGGYKYALVLQVTAALLNSSVCFLSINGQTFPVKHFTITYHTEGKKFGNIL